MIDLFNNKFDFTIPLGMNCNAANGLALAGKRKFKLPFDWLQITDTHVDNIHKIYTYLITCFNNNNLNFDTIEIKKNEDGNFNIIFNNFILFMPHEDTNHTIDDIRIKYKIYYNRLLKILKSNKKNILIVLYSKSKNIETAKNIIHDYHSYFTKYFPLNTYDFISVNLAPSTFDYYENNIKWKNICINKHPKWITKNGERIWTDPLLEDIVKNFKKINVENNLDIL